jgi:hypothetical protein
VKNGHYRSYYYCYDIPEGRATLIVSVNLPQTVGVPGDIQQSPILVEEENNALKKSFSSLFFPKFF